jgi:Holliday junction resolvase RusA-like endonuclease
MESAFKSRTLCLVRFFSDDRSAPAIHNLVKFYLDELRGIAFVDDRQISHLTAVFCRLDSWLPQLNAPGILDSTGRDSVKKSDVYITIEHLVDYKRRFDLCFELLDEHDFAEDAEEERETSESTLDTGDGLYSPMSKSELAALPEDVRRAVKEMEQAMMKIERDALQTRLQRRLLSISTLGRFDRPSVHRGIASSHLFGSRVDHPLVIDLGELPQRRGESGHYTDKIRAQMQQFKTNWELLDLFNVPLDVDVRVSSHTLAARKDLDNIMRDIAPILTDEFFQTGSFLNGYRIYVSEVMDEPSMANKLQLKFLPMGAIRDFDQMLSRTVEEGEEWLADRI